MDETTLRPNAWCLPEEVLLSAAAHLRRSSRNRPNDPLEIGLRPGVAVDWHVLGHIKLQPRNVPEQRNGVRADICGGRQSPKSMSL
jgi:hypothetical protein